MKKLIVAVLSALIAFSFSIKASAGSMDTSAKAAILMCADTSDIIYSKNCDTKLSMASTTKIMTALILSEQEDLSKEAVVTKEMVLVEGSSMGLKVGDKVSYMDLIYGMLLASGNDAANVTAFALGGSIEGFADLMNNKAKALGLKNTNFVTPSGLDDDNHYSTAYDMAVLTAYALKNSVFKEVCSTYVKTLEFGEPKAKHTYQNHNRLLKSYEGLIGVKTGFTKKSGRCLVTAANRDGSTLIAVTLSDPNDWEDHKKMLDFGFENIEKVYIKPEIPYSVPVISGDCDSFKVFAEEKSFTVNKNNPKNIKYKITLPKFLYSEISAGEKVGNIEYFYNNKSIGNSNIISLADVNLKNNKPPFKKRFKENLVKILRLVA